MDASLLMFLSHKYTVILFLINLINLNFHNAYIDVFHFKYFIK